MRTSVYYFCKQNCQNGLFSGNAENINVYKLPADVCQGFWVKIQTKAQMKEAHPLVFQSFRDSVLHEFEFRCICPGASCYKFRAISRSMSGDAPIGPLLKD